MAGDNFNRYCEQLLVQYKRRNGKAVTRHLKSVCDILRHEDDHVVQTKFGGSTVTILAFLLSVTAKSCAKGLGRFTEPLATSRRWFCLPSTLAHPTGQNQEPLA